MRVWGVYRSHLWLRAFSFENCEKSWSGRYSAVTEGLNTEHEFCTDAAASRAYAGSMLSMGLGGYKTQGASEECIADKKHVQKLNGPVILLTTVDTVRTPNPTGHASLQRCPRQFVLL